MAPAHVYVRDSQLRKGEPDAITTHRPECRYVAGLTSVEVHWLVAKAAGWKPCARCKPMPS